jgi:hypothetical protein
MFTGTYSTGHFEWPLALTHLSSARKNRFLPYRVILISVLKQLKNVGNAEHALDTFPNDPAAAEYFSERPSSYLYIKEILRGPVQPYTGGNVQDWKGFFFYCTVW